MATYFITTQQLGKLVTSHFFHKKRFMLATTHISKLAFESMFKSPDTMAYSSQFEILEGDVLLFTDHIAQCKAYAEVEVGVTAPVTANAPDSPASIKQGDLEL